MNRLPGLLLVLIVAGCATAYHSPTADQPHAILKFRRSYARSAGTSLAERLTVDGHEAYGRTVPAASAAVPRTDAILIHPGAAILAAFVSFFHIENQLVTETYTEQVPYSTTELHTCGFGTYAHMCTETVTRYRTETKSRMVTRMVRVTDAECSRQRPLAAGDREVYLLEILFQGPGVCRLSCFRQTAEPDGSFTTSPCPTPRSAMVAK